MSVNSHQCSKPNHLEKVNKFDKLPDELVLKILSHLELSFLAKKVSLVSKRFRDLCLDPSLWTKLPNEIPASMDMKDKLILIRRCKQLKVLTLSDRESEFLAIKALESSSKLRELSVHKSDIVYTGELLDAIATFGSTSLKILKLIGTWNEKAFAAKASALQNLTRLELGDRKCYSHMVLEAIGNNCNKLEVLQMNYCWFNYPIKPEVMDAFFSGALKDTLKEIIFNSIKLVGEGSWRSVWKCQNLQKLIIGKSVELSMSDFQSISKLANLKSLTINHTRVTSAGVISAFTDHKLSNLTYLDLSSLRFLNDAAVCTIAENCPKLSFLDLSFCNEITDVGVKMILQECVEMKSLGLKGNQNVTIGAFRDGAKARLMELIISRENFGQEEKVELQQLMLGIDVRAL